MTEHDYLWLLARMFVVLRRGYITSHVAPIYDELKTVLTGASGVQIDSTTPGDDELLDLFRPVEKPPYVENTNFIIPPDKPVDQPKSSRRSK